MVRVFQIAALLLMGAAIAVLGLAAWGGFGLTKHIIAAFDEWGASAPAPTLAKLNEAIDAVNAPCGGGKPCGVLATVNKTVTKIGDAIVTTEIGERETTPHVTAAMDALRDTSIHLSQTADQLGGTATAATGTLQAAADTLQAATGTIGDLQKGMKPLLASYTEAGENLNALLKAKAVSETLTNVDAFTASAAGVSHNLDLISAHLEKTVDAPTPLWKTAIPGAKLGVQLWACAWYHVCVE